VALAAGCLGVAGGAAITATGQTSTQNRVLFGVLNGKNEIGTDGRKRAGDLDGRGSATAIYDEGKLCYALTSKNISSTTGAHIHRGTRGRNGGIVIPLEAPSPADPGASSGCRNVDESDIRPILRNPHRYYWNIHSTEKPNGAIRGQVSAKRN
jgi:hypothetical protein